MYLALKELQKLNLLNKCLKKGVISLNHMRWLMVYETYLQEKEKASKLQAICNTAEAHQLSERQVYNIIKMMK